MSEIRGLVASYCFFHLTGSPCFQESLLILVFLGFISFVRVSESPSGSCVTVVPSLPRVQHALCPCRSQLFLSQSKVLRVMLFIALLYGIPASTSLVCLWAFPSSIASACLVCLSLLVFFLRCGRPPGPPTVFPSGTHVVFAPVTTVPASSTTPGRHRITASPSDWLASSPKPVSLVKWCF